MWIKLTTIQDIDVNGIQHRYYPGDWVDIGKQSAIRLITMGKAEKPGVSVTAEMVDYTSGIVCLGKMGTNEKQQILETIPHLEMVENDQPELLFSETLIYHPSAQIRPELLHVGFKWLEKFQVIVPLWDYEQLACHIGRESDKGNLKEIIKELRVPVYDTRMIWIRRCDETKDLIDSWQKHKLTIEDDKLAFLAAVYEIKPVLLALPITWSRKS